MFGGCQALTDAYEDHEPCHERRAQFTGAVITAPLTISLGCCLFRAICEVMKGEPEICSVMAKKVCLLPRPCFRGTWGIETFQFQRISGKLSLVDCTSILPIPRPSFGAKLSSRTLFGAQIWPPMTAPRTNCYASRSRRSLFRQATKQRRFSESVVASYSLCQTHNDQARGLISA
jgi:hypothetical protein